MFVPVEMDLFSTAESLKNSEIFNGSNSTKFRPTSDAKTLPDVTRICDHPPMIHQL